MSLATSSPRHLLGRASKTTLSLSTSSSLVPFLRVPVSRLGKSLFRPLSIIFTGMSSTFSAAMVVASTLAFLTVNNKLDGVTKGSLVEMAMENEKRVGVNSGG